MDPQPPKPSTSRQKRKNRAQKARESHTPPTEFGSPSHVYQYLEELTKPKEEVERTTSLRTLESIPGTPPPLTPSDFDPPPPSSVYQTRPSSPTTMDNAQIASMITEEVERRLKERNGNGSTSSAKELNLGTPEPFTGVAHKLDGFLQECSLHFAVKPEVYHNADRQVGFILSYMKTGDAKRWKEQYLKTRKDAIDANHPFSLAPNNCYEDFEDELRKSFKDELQKSFKDP